MTKPTRKEIFQMVETGQITSQEGLKLLSALQAGATAAAAGSDHKSESAVSRSAESAADPGRLRDQLEEYLRGIIAAETKTAPSAILPNLPFEKYGIDSVLVVNLNRRLEAAFGQLSKTLFFEYQTLRDVGAYFLQNHMEQVQRIVGAPAAAEMPAPAPAEARAQRPAAEPSGFPSRRFAKPRRESAATVERQAAPATAVQQGDIAIIGVSGRYPKARNLEEYWEVLRTGQDCITEIPKDRWDHTKYYDPDKNKVGKSYSKWGGFIDGVDHFDPLFFSISPREAEFMDPQERLFLQTVWHTIEDAGYTKARLSNAAVGVFVGVMYAQYQFYGAEQSLLGNVMALGGSYASIANRVSYFFDFHGPSIAMDTMCSSSLTAIHLACESIRRGDCNVAVAGGVNVSVHPNKYILLSQGRFVSSDGYCHSFGEGGDGYVPGEGVGAILLKPLDRAITDGDTIYAVIKGSSLNHGGKTNGYTVPNPNAQGRLIAEALRRAQINPRTISYMEAHGTGTSLGDPIEITGLVKAFRKLTADRQYCSIGSVKANIGHLESAAGIAAVTKVLLQMKHGQLVPSIHSEQLNPNIDFEASPFYVQHSLEEWKRPVIAENGEARTVPRRAGISSFGAGGSNAHLILEEYQPSAARREPETQQPRVVVLSAKTPDRLQAYAQNLLLFLDGPAVRDGVSLSEIAYTLQTGREEMEERLAVVVSGLDELRDILRAFGQGQNPRQIVLGNVKQSMTRLGALLQEDDGKRLLMDLVQQQKLQQIAQLWVEGIEVDWDLLYAGRSPHRVPMPPYPFAPERYWVPDLGPQTERVQNGGGNLHPLIDTNASTLEEQSYKKTLAGDQFYLRDHVIGGQMVLPGAVSLEMARVAGDLALPGRRATGLRNVSWEKPVVVHTEPVEVCLSLFPGQGQVEYEVSTSEEQDRTVHARGFLLFEDEAPGAETLDLERVRVRCARSIDGSEFYRELEKVGLQYGPTLQTVRQLFAGDSESLARLELDQELRDGAKAFVLHPALVDGALQAIAPLVGSSDRGLYLPVSIAELATIAPLTPICYAHAVRRVTPSSGESDTLWFDIGLYDEHGQALATLAGLAVTRVAATSFRAAGSHTDEPLYLANQWAESGTAERRESSLPSANLLVLGRNEGLHRIAAEATGLSLDRVVLVMPGKEFREVEAGRVYTVDPARPEDYSSLLGSLRSRNWAPTHVVHRWAEQTDYRQPQALDDQLRTGVYSVLHLTQAFMREKLPQVSLLYVFETDMAGGQPVHAAFSGFAATVGRENPNYCYKSVELAGGAPKRLWELFAAEFSGPADREICYSGEKRLHKRLAEWKPGLTADAVSLKKHGVYLITGGMGGIGLICARHLASRVRARLVLVGRSGLDEAKQKQLQELKVLGTEVEYVQADIASAEAVDRVIRETLARYQTIDGVFHSAGVLADSFLLKKSTQEFDAVLAPKVHGTLAFFRALENRRLDFFVLFSSTAAVLGNVGQCDYSFANSFMDHLAAANRPGRNWGKVVSVNWPLWAEGGMQIDQQSVQMLEQMTGIVPLQSAAGMRAMETALKTDLPQLVVVAGDKARIRQALGAGQAEPGPAGGSAAAPAPDDSLSPKVEELLKSIFVRVLKIPGGRVRIQEPFEAYGVDSIMIMELNRELEAQFGELPKTLFFQYQNIAELTGYFVAQHREKLEKLFGKPVVSLLPVPAEPPRKLAEAPRAPQPRKNRFLAGSTAGIQEHGQFDVAIVGLSGRYPQANSRAQFWENLKNGKDCVTEIPADRWDVNLNFDPEKGKRGKTYGRWGGFIDGIDQFDPLFFNISPIEAEFTDPQERLFLETAWHTMEDAGYTRAGLSQYRVGVFVGVMFGHYQLYGAEESARGNVMATGSSYASIANRVSYFLNLHGPSLAVDTMCSSSLTAIHLACESLRRGESEVALAGGVNLTVHPNKYILLSQAKFLASDGRCRSFGEGGDGYVPGEGVGAVLLKPLHRAMADGDRIYGVIKATCINHGGKVNGYTVPNPNAQADLIVETLRKANIDPRTMSYIEAHGTGTSLGDPIEVAALTTAFGGSDKQYCPIGSVKSNIGHLESAAGIAGLTKVLLQMQHGQLVPSIHADILNSHIDFASSPFHVQRKLEEWKRPVVNQRSVPRRAAISSFGAGGSNAHLILEEFEQPSPQASVGSEGPHLFVLSAKNAERLKAHAGILLDHLNGSDRAVGVAHADEASVLADIRRDLVSLLSGLIGVELDLTEEITADTLDWAQLVRLSEQMNLRYGVDSTPALFSGFAALDQLAATFYAEFRHRFAGLAQTTASQSEAREPRPDVNLAGIVYALQIRREAMEERLAMVVTSAAELCEKLERFCRGEADLPGVVTGNVNRDKEKAEILVGGRAAREFVGTLIRDREFDRLGKLWVIGVDVDWAQLWADARPERVSLPGYPFARERYWVQVTKGGPAGTGTALTEVRKLHPLISQNLSTVKGFKYAASLTGEEPLVRDFRLYDRPVLAGSACLEMVRAAGEFGTRESVTQIRQVAWAGPVALGAGPQDLELELFPGDESVIWEIRGSDESGARIVHAQGELVSGEAETSRSLGALEISEILSRCTVVTDGPAQYASLDNSGLHYGAGYHAVRTLHLNPSRTDALGLLALPTGAEGQGWGFLHPALLEGALQVAIGLGAPDRAAYVTRIGQVDLRNTGSSPVYAYVSLAESRQYNIQLADPDGQVVARLSGVALADVGTLATRAGLILEKRWRPSGVVAGTSSPIAGSVLVLVNDETVVAGHDLFDGTAGVRTVIVHRDAPLHSGEAFDFANPVAGATLAERLLADHRALAGVVDLSDLSSQAPERSADQMGKVALLQKLVASRSREPFFVLHLTRGLQVFGNTQPSLTGADFAGLAKMLGAEYRQVRSRTVDVDCPPTDKQSLRQVIQTELAVHGGSTEVCYRKGTRYTPQFEETLTVDLNGGARAGAFPCRPDQVVVITGGTRGIGAEVARHAVRNGVRKLVLMGVQPVPVRERWDSILQSGQAEPGTVARIQLVRELERQGATVELYIGSLTDKGRLAEFFDQVRRNCGSVAGVIHCAGLSIDKNPAFISKHPDDMRKVCEPKIAGLQTLYEIFARDRLEYFVLFSSVSALTPALATGVSDYAMANAFADYFAAHRFSRGETAFKSIAWPSWKDVGMGENRSPVYTQLGLLTVTVGEGLALLDAAMSKQGSAYLVPLVVNPESFNAVALAEGIPQRAALPSAPSSRPDRASEIQDSVSNVKIWLKVLFTDELNISKERFDDYTAFGDYGVDSILLAELVRKIEHRIGTKVEPSALLEHPTLHQLAKYLASQTADAVPAAAVAATANVVAAMEAGAPGTGATLKFAGAAVALQSHADKVRPTNVRGGQVRHPRSSKVAVVGVACHFPGSPNKDEFWQSLRNGKDCTVEVPPSRWDVARLYSPTPQKGKSISKWGGFIQGIEDFDPQYFGIREEEAYHTDPLIRQVLEVGAETVNDAGYIPKDLWGQRVGVFVGARAGAFAPLIGEEVNKNSIVGLGQNFIAARISQWLNLKGPSMVVDTACSSSLVSVHLACQSLMTGESDLALAGGVDLVLDEKPHVMLSEAGALSPDGKCHTFDEKANGFVLGEGCGIVLLKLLDQAVADGDRIYAVIDASAINNDGHTMGITTPNPDAQSEVIARALKAGGIDASEISYVETHGTGTMIGDPIELKALTRVFREVTGEKQFCAVGTVKSNIGHLLSAASIASLIKVVLSITHRQLPPTLNCEVPNPRFKFNESPFYPNTKLQDWKGRQGVLRAGISSFGFGGTNAHLIVSEFDQGRFPAYQCKQEQLPPLVFQRKRYWVGARKPQAALPVAAAPAPGFLHIEDEGAVLPPKRQPAANGFLAITEETE
ncbi:MAG TPA: SDR family NAD(P)-dependent oxidoreductase [Symbiobacteriaceae bacterium]